MATISNNTIVTLIDTQTNSGTVVLPKTSDIPYRAILFKDLYGTFDTKPLTLNTQSPDVFEDGTSVKRFNDKFSYLTLYADTSHSKWVVLSATQNNSITVSTLNGVQTGYISTLNVNSLTFGPGNGWLDLTALRAVLVSTIQLDAAIGNFSSISGNGSQIVALNAISSLSLQSTIVGLGTFGYLSTNTVPSTIVGLGTFGYLSTNTVPSTIVGLGTFGYLSTNTVPSTIVGLGTFGYLSTNTVPSTIVGLGTFGYLSTNTVPSTIVGLGTFGYLSTNTVPSTIVGLGTFGYLSTNTVPSTIVGLGTFGYLSTNTVPSTIVGLGTFGYLSTNTVPSTIVGLGSFGYISTSQLQSTVVGLLEVPELGSTITGLGTFGYISSTQLTSTVTGLGNIYISSFTGSTNFISSGQGFISSLTVNSLTFGPGNGWLDLTALRAVLVSTIQLDAAIGNFSSISGNGSQIVALNAISSLSLQSTIVGLGTFGYLSTNIVPSTIVGLGTFGYLSTNTVPSTIVGLGTFGYLSTNTVPSTIVGLGTFGYLSTNTVPSTIVGLGTFGYLSTNIVPSTIVGLGTFGYLSTNTVPSTIVGLGTFGYLSTNTVPSTIVGLGTFGYLSTNTVPSTIVGLGTFGYLSTNTVPSTIVGLGTFGYISTSQLQSTVTGLIDSPEVQSTIIGLGTFGYISTIQLTSTVIGLGNIYISTFTGSTTFLSSAVGFISSLNVNSLVVGNGTGWVDFGAIRAVIVSSIQTNTGSIFTDIITTRAVSTINISSSVLFTNSYNGVTAGGNINMNGSVFPTTGGGVNRDFGSITNRWNNIYVSTISSIHITTSTLQAQTNINASTIAVDRIIGRNSQFNIYTNNLFPLSGGATVGFGSNIGGGGFYNQGTFRSTFTQVIQPTLDSNAFSNIVRIEGFTSTQQIFTSSIFARANMSTQALTTSNLFVTKIGPYNTTRVEANYIHTEGNVANSAIGSSSRYYNEGYFSNVWSSNLNVSTMSWNGGSDIRSTIIQTGTLSSQNIVVSSITTNNISANVINVSLIRGDGSQLFNLNAISSLSLESTIVGLGTFGYLSTNTVPSTIVGLGTFGYLSTNTVPSTIDGLGSFGYISSTQLTSTVTGLGNIYMSTFTGSTNFISSGQGFISTLNINSLTFGPGNGWLDLTALRAVLVSTIQIDAGIGNFSSISGNGSQIVALNAISSLSLQSTIVGLGTFGYLSTNTVPSTIVGLGTTGYISSTQLISTINGWSRIVATSDLIPSVDNTYDLGSASKRWRDLYVAGTSIHLGTQLVLSEDDNNRLSTNYGVITESLDTNFVSTGSLTTQAIDFRSDSLGGIVFTINGAPASYIGILDEAYDMSITNVNSQNINLNAPNSINLSATNINIDGILDLESNEIRNVNTITTEYISSSLGTVTLSNSHFIPSADDTYELGSATNRWKKLYVAGASIHLGNSLVLSEDLNGRLSTNGGIIANGLDANNYAISNVLQTANTNSATTNLCLPTSNFITSQTITYSDSAFTRILDNPSFFTHNLPFTKYRVQCVFTGIIDTLDAVSYFFLTLSNNATSKEFLGITYNFSTPYVHIQPSMFDQTIVSFNFIDIFNISPSVIGNKLYPQLYARNSSHKDNIFTDANCYVITEPVV